MRKTLYPALAISFASGCGATHHASSLEGRLDAATVTITADGLFDVLCKNGERQLVTEADFLANKVCERPPVLCGKYAKNDLSELSGTYIVTCNTSFAGDITIKEGTRLLADDKWSIRFRSIQAPGTAAKPIVFGMSRNSAETEWGDIIFDPSWSTPPDFNPKDGYIKGSRLSHVDFSAINGSLSLSNIFANNIAVAKASAVTITSAYITESTINSGIVSSSSEGMKSSYWIRNTIRLDVPFTTNYLRGSFLSHNTLTSSSQSWIDFDNSVLTFNTLTDVNPWHFCNYASRGQIAANRFNDPEIIKCLGSGFHNTTGELPDLEVIANFPIQRFTESSAGEPVTFNFLALDRSGFRFDRAINTEAHYKVDGGLYKYETSWEGFAPQITINDKESYDIVPGIQASEKPFILSFDRIILDVY